MLTDQTPATAIPSVREVLRIWLLVASVIASVFVGAGCDGSSSDVRPTPTVPLPTPTWPEALPSHTPGTQADQDLQQNSNLLGQTFGGIYKQARPKISAVGGTARYWGDNLDRIEIMVSYSAFDVGFPDYEYNLDCSAPQPPKICTLVRAFPAGEVEQTNTVLARVGTTGPAVLRVFGKAEGAWKPRGKPRTYGGECGESECSLGDDTLKLRRGMPIKSNQSLSCLRALCLLHQSGLANSGLKVELHGVVTQGSTPGQEARRPEMALFAWLPNDLRRTIWSGFLGVVR